MAHLLKGIPWPNSKSCVSASANVGYFGTQVIVVCTLVPFFTDKDYRSWINKGLVILLTACPCAIVIGAPLATTCAIAAAATKGIPDSLDISQWNFSNVIS